MEYSSMIKAVLFDLDGTLLDTAPDFHYVLNQLRFKYGYSALAFETIRSIINLGSKGMLKFTLGIEETDNNFDTIREQFFHLYLKHLADKTQFFPGMEKVLTHLETNNIPWGIVTNKLTKHTLTLLKALQLDRRPVCIVCGDTLPKYKPDPEPILHACQLLQEHPTKCLYLGDSAIDVRASKAAGTQSLVALYGYISSEEDPYSWGANGYIQEPIDLVDWINK